MVAEQNRLYITIDPPQNANSIIVRNNGRAFFETGWQEDIDPNGEDNNHNIYIQIPEFVSGTIELIASRGAGKLSQPININLNDYPYIPISYDIDDPNFVPVMSTAYPFGYDMLGATQVESGFPTLDNIHDNLLESVDEWYEGSIEMVSFNIEQVKNEEISMSWHLTSKDKSLI